METTQESEEPTIQNNSTEEDKDMEELETMMNELDNSGEMTIDVSTL